MVTNTLRPELTLFKKQNSKQQNGAVGLLTNDLITRETLYHQAVILALIPFLNQALYSQNELIAD